MTAVTRAGAVSRCARCARCAPPPPAPCGWACFGPLLTVPSGVSPELATAATDRGLRRSAFLVEPDGPALGEIARLIDQGRVTVEVEDVFPLEWAERAHRRLEEGRTRGKIVLRVDR